MTSLDELATAISAGDAEAADAGLERFSEVASSAPVDIRADMEAVADALSEAVGVAMTDEAADPDDLELRREASTNSSDGSRPTLPRCRPGPNGSAGSDSIERPHGPPNRRAAL
ncbi:MAG: hypothetical protein M5U19_23105 [Microthrixaceae bacterium]|nr:hypothetical protein [Microthrixaceae bacterium]